MAFTIVKYEEHYKERWDQFVINNSVNGTFLQTWNFLDYHPKGRFKDASVLVMQGSNIVAVVPACDTEEDGKRCFFSHKGSTFGGIVISKEKYDISTMEELFPCLEEYLRLEGYERAFFKNTSDIFSEKSSDLLDYYFYKNNYDYCNELSFFIDCGKMPEDIISGWFATRRRGYRNSLKSDLSFKRIETDEEIADFYEVLCKNLKKFESTPVHTLDELLEFKHSRLAEEVDFYGAYLGDKLVAGTMLFYFGKQVLHTQYLAQDVDYAKFYTMNYLDYEVIRLAREKGFSKFSFGISTEERGKVLNTTLALFKEGFGCDYCLNRSYTKNFG
ncbi:MAG: GNAT family N-acetyltransferase [Butyrivibrio sp.]|nr:GNAT family N-acetyltransferase [Butyrivibrio sp.]